MNMCDIDGARFRTLLNVAGIRQRELASRIGVTHYNVSRWCKRGEHTVLKKNLVATAAVLGMNLQGLLDECAPKRLRGDSAHLSAAEAEWLEQYRKLTPLEQAKVRVALDDLVRKIRTPTR